jgi:hypothetical protein
MIIYIIGLIIHIVIFRQNTKNKRPFRLSFLLIYICFFRTVTMSLRMALATHPTNVSLAIAAQVFVTAGVPLLFILNLVFAQRLLRAMHPDMGWHSITNRLFQAYYVLVALSLISVITCFIQSLYTLDTHTRQVDRGFTLYGATFFLVAALFPVPFVLANYFTLDAQGKKAAIQTKGEDLENVESPQRPRMAGSVANGARVVVVGALLLTFGAGFRTGVAYSPARPANAPAWFHSKACFYVFNFVTELCVIYLYAAARVDRTFYVPAVEKEKERSKEAV